MRHEILFSARMAAATQRRTKKHFSAASRLLMRFFYPRAETQRRREEHKSISPRLCGSSRDFFIRAQRRSDAEKNIKAFLRGSARVYLFIPRMAAATQRYTKPFLHGSARVNQFFSQNNKAATRWGKDISRKRCGQRRRTVSDGYTKEVTPPAEPPALFSERPPANLFPIHFPCKLIPCYNHSGGDC
jgi:hypothetical protein